VIRTNGPGALPHSFEVMDEAFDKIRAENRFTVERQVTVDRVCHDLADYTEGRLRRLAGIWCMVGDDAADEVAAGFPAMSGHAPRGELADYPTNVFAKLSASHSGSGVLRRPNNT